LTGRQAVAAIAISKAITQHHWSLARAWPVEKSELKSRSRGNEAQLNFGFFISQSFLTSVPANFRNFLSVGEPLFPEISLIAMKGKRK
jgi:hypothetical protein